MKITIKAVQIIIIAALIALFISPWCINVYKLINCDFEADYKCELVHAIGVVVPPASYITVWVESDS